MKQFLSCAYFAKAEARKPRWGLLILTLVMGMSQAGSASSSSDFQRVQALFEKGGALATESDIAATKLGTLVGQCLRLIENRQWSPPRLSYDRLEIEGNFFVTKDPVLGDRMRMLVRPNRTGYSALYVNSLVKSQSGGDLGYDRLFPLQSGGFARDYVALRKLRSDPRIFVFRHYYSLRRSRTEAPYVIENMYCYLYPASES